MNRFSTYLLGPELIALIASVGTFALASRYNSGMGKDVDLMERCSMWLPFVVVPLVFLTLLMPGARQWSWLGRAIFFAYLALCVCGGRFIQAFGTGAKGQDVGFLMILMFGTVLISVGTAIAGAWILAVQRPGFGTWFVEHKFLGSLATVAAMIPIGFLLGISSMVIVTLLAAIYSGLKR